jgi:hypothetical protein
MDQATRAGEQDTGYILYDVNGNPMSGDTHLDGHMKARADELGGYIEDASTGERVYPS